MQVACLPGFYHVPVSEVNIGGLAGLRAMKIIKN
jgi:hypothetical protein